jgi:[lysine-biosynthesis-protein LysW]--L-2-aminoadipate ligase
MGPDHPNAPRILTTGLTGQRHSAVVAVALEAQGARVLHTGDPAAALKFNPHLTVPMGWEADYYHADSAARQTLAALEDNGYSVLNTTEAILTASHKLKAYEALRRADLRTPRTWDLDEVSTWPEGHRTLVLKPAQSAGGRNVSLATHLDEALAAREEWDNTYAGVQHPTAVLQEYIPGAKCHRLVILGEEVLTAYEKMNDGLVKNIAAGATPRPFTPTPALTSLATAMVEAVGANFAGVDILEDADGNYVALEVGAPFSFNRRDDGLISSLARTILTHARHEI